MKIRIEDTAYEGTGTEIMDQLRKAAFDPTEFPDTESYIWQLRSNFIRIHCPIEHFYIIKASLKESICSIKRSS